jgi:HAD superfamily hydrolase (TIGR01509 family)
MLKAILFDRDGVLLNSEAINIKSSAVAFAEQGINITDDDKQHIIAVHPDDYADYFLSKYNFDFKKFRQRKLEIFNEDFKNIDTKIFFQNTIDLVKKLKQQNFLLGLTTSSEKENTYKLLTKMGLENIFDTIITFDDCQKRKPNPDPYLITAKKLKVDPSECLVIEDSNIGIQAAKNANIKYVAIPNQYTINQDFSMADYVVKTAGEVEKIILSLI